MIPVDPTLATTAWPLAGLFDALRREGFQLRPDDYVEVVQVLNTFQPQSYADLQALIAPLIVTSDEEQEKFDRIFERVRQAEGIQPHVVTKKRLPWNWLITAFLVLVVVGYTAFFWPAPTFKTDLYLLKPEGPYEVGDTLVFSIDSSMRQAAGSRARWQWETADGQPYPHPNELELQVVAEHAGPLVVNVRGRQGRGLLFTSWTDSIRSIEIPICDNLPVVQIDSVRLSTSPLRYRFSARLVGSVKPLQRTNWQLNDGVVASNQTEWEHTFKAGSVPAAYNVRFTAFPDTVQRLCFGEARLEVDVPELNQPPFTIDLQPAGNLIKPITQRTNAYAWAIGLVGTLLAILMGIYYWLTAQKPAKKNDLNLTGTNPLSRFASTKPPLEIPFENRDRELITLDQAFYRTVRLLRQPAEGEIRRLNIGQTMQATMHEGGLPTLVYQPHFTETEYLFLIDQSQVRSQQVALFEYLFQAFTRENVCVERFFFHKTFDRFTNETHPKGLSLRQLSDSYTGRTLIIWSNGYPLLYPPYPVVEPFVRDALVDWPLRAILTPVPFADWGSKELALKADFLLLPADLVGQLRLMQVLTENQPNQDAYLEQHEKELYSTDYVDFRSVAGLRKYLGDELIQWLAALAIYPRIRWEVVVEMGRTLMTPEAVNFTNLLKLARISWMQEGSFPDKTRLELLKTLHPDNEVKARVTLLRMLNKAEQYFPGDHFYDGEKFLLQTASQFALYAYDSEKYAEYQPAQQVFKALYEQGQYPDGAMLRYLENPDGIWTTLLPTTGSSIDQSSQSSVDSLRPIPLQAYLTNLPAPPEAAPEEPPINRKPQYLLAAIGATFLSLLGLWYLSSRPQNQEIDLDQQIPVTISLDSSLCVTARNTVNNAYNSPRWRFFLNDSLLTVNSLHATRSLPLRNLIMDSAKVPADSMALRAMFSVSDTMSGGGRQYSSVQFSRDTLRVRISCPNSLIVPPTASNDSSSTVYIQYSFRDQINKARQLQTRLSASGFRVPGIELRATYRDSTQVRYFANQDRSEADSVASIVKSLFKLRIVRIVKVGGIKKAPVEVWLNTGAATNAFICQSVPISWANQFNGWQAKVNGYTYTINTSRNRITLNTESSKVPPTVDPKTGALSAIGSSLSIELAGSIESICRQNGVYIVQLANHIGRTLLIRNVTRTSCTLAVVRFNANQLNGSQGKAYFDRVLSSASFRQYRYVTTKQPQSQTTNADAVQQTTNPGNEYNQSPIQTATPAPTSTESLRLAAQKSADMTVKAGLEAYQNGQYEEAVKLFDQSLEKNPANAFVLDMKGSSLFKLKRYDEAEATLLTATKVDPKDAWPYFDLARVYCAMGRSAEANSAKRQAIKLQPDMQTIMRKDREFIRVCGAEASAK
ncbi:tetratricopeptide repeat protein [Spirosoma sp. HMF4905]|uniref:Tetratricopeptide repeat protein n=1 Tax=Spirosoma arboris TaxID=2682092 RepID=A0A7K1SK29_9BACT|nr:tetratricopeptide repeat protein [Spirosoma arboris]MVM34160.1 tetratricopeptide repeat protein [Spirosoma arboris]